MGDAKFGMGLGLLEWFIFWFFVVALTIFTLGSEFGVLVTTKFCIKIQSLGWLVIFNMDCLSCLPEIITFIMESMITIKANDLKVKLTDVLSFCQKDGQAILEGNTDDYISLKHGGYAMIMEKEVWIKSGDALAYLDREQVMELISQQICVA